MDVKVNPRLHVTLEPDEARLVSLALGGLLKPETPDAIAAQGLGIKFNQQRGNSMREYVTIADGAVSKGYQFDDFTDVDVINTDSLDDAHAAKFDQQWIVQFADGSYEGFDTEDEACAYQRAWRHAHGRNGITGEV